MILNDIKEKKIILFGAGSLAKEIIKECEKSCYTIEYILDNNESKIDTVFEGYIIKSPKKVELNSNEIILIASSFGLEIQQQLKEMSLEANIHYFNYTLLFPSVGPLLKKPGKFDELSEIGDQIQYGIDEVGIVLKSKNESVIYRAIYSDKKNVTLDILKILEEKQFYNRKIINAEISDKKTESFPLILRHPFINYCSNAGSWTLNMLINGMLTIIQLVEELGRDELTLKDGHIFNLTYVDNKFQWVDFGSIIKGKIKKNVLQQMVESFVFPSILIINGYARDYYLISDKQRYIVKYYMIQSLLSEDEKVVFDKIYDSNNSFDNLVLLEELKAFIDVYFNGKSIIENTAWENYQQLDLIDSESNLKQKKVRDYLSKSNGTTLIDIAGNKGEYCVYAAKKLNMTGVLIDYDYKCIEVAYKYFNENNIKFIPLVNDFNNFPNNLMFMKNGQRFDVVLCLAFIHHLVFSNGFTFERICDVLYDVTENHLIIEFIQITDPHIMLWNNKYFTWYNEENFRKIFSDKFDIMESENISETRKLFFMQKK